MNHLLLECNDLLKHGGFDYAFCGGFAIELFLDKTVREHGDIDISAYWDERDKIILFMQSLGWEVYELCGGAMAHHIIDVANQIKSKRNIFCITNDCKLVSFTQTNEPDMFIVDFDHSGQETLTFIEFLFNNKDNDRFLYARNHDISLPLSQAIIARNGINYLAPEMVLLYKSTDTEREGYQLDYEMAMSAMTMKQKKWLWSAIAIMNPNGHKWHDNDAVMSFSDFVEFRNVKIKGKDHERIVRMFYPHLTSVCGLPEALSKIIGQIIGIDFSDTHITTGCFNGINDENHAPYGMPDLYCKWDNGIRLFVYGALPQSDLKILKRNEIVLFAISDNITNTVERVSDRHFCMRGISS